MSISVSSLSISSGLRSSLQRIQTQLDSATFESTEGRHADVGLALGKLTGTAVSYHLEDSAAAGQLESNKLVDSRYTAINAALANLRSSAESVRQVAITGFADETRRLAAEQTAASAMQSFSGTLNTSLNGQYLFGGQQSGTPPITAYSDGSAPKNATTASFATYLSQINKTASTITGDEMRTYLNGDYQKLFATGTPGQGWSQWSGASDEQIVSRISKTETVESSISANDQAFRDLASGFTMVNDLATSDLSAEARTALASAAQVKIGAGLDGLTRVGADIGFRQTRITAANTDLTKQQDIMKASIESLEGVDQYEANIRMQQLLQQQQIALKATGEILNLNILDYL